jgi:hypothetical protein
MQCQMYSVKEFDASLRSEFVLEADPFLATPAGDRTRKYLQNLGVILYRDENHSHGILMQPIDDDPTPINERSSFQAYLQSAVLNKEGFPKKVVPWPKPKAAYVSKMGDTLSWLFFNRLKTVLKIDEMEVTCA